MDDLRRIRARLTQAIAIRGRRPIFRDADMHVQSLPNPDAKPFDEWATFHRLIVLNSNASMFRSLLKFAKDPTVRRLAQVAADNRAIW